MSEKFKSQVINQGIIGEEIPQGYTPDTLKYSIGDTYIYLAPTQNGDLGIVSFGKRWP